MLWSIGGLFQNRAILYRGHPLLSCAGASKNPDAHALQRLRGCAGRHQSLRLHHGGESIPFQHVPPLQAHAGRNHIPPTQAAPQAPDWQRVRLLWPHRQAAIRPRAWWNTRVERFSVPSVQHRHWPPWGQQRRRRKGSRLSGRGKISRKLLGVERKWNRGTCATRPSALKGKSRVSSQPITNP